MQSLREEHESTSQNAGPALEAQELQQLREENLELTTKLEDKEKVLKKIADEFVEQLEAQVNAAREELLSEIEDSDQSELLREVSELRDVKSEQAAELDEVFDRINKQEQVLARLERELSAAKSDKDVLQDEKDNLLEKIRTLEREVTSEGVEDSLKKSSSSKTREPLHVALRGLINETKEKAEELQNAGLGEDMSNVLATLHDFEDKLQQRVHSVSELETVLVRMQTAITTLNEGADTGDAMETIKEGTLLLNQVDLTPVSTEGLGIDVEIAKTKVEGMLNMEPGDAHLVDMCALLGSAEDAVSELCHNEQLMKSELQKVQEMVVEALQKLKKAVETYPPNKEQLAACREILDGIQQFIQLSFTDDDQGAEFRVTSLKRRLSETGEALSSMRDKDRQLKGGIENLREKLMSANDQNIELVKMLEIKRLTEGKSNPEEILREEVLILKLKLEESERVCELLEQQAVGNKEIDSLTLSKTVPMEDIAGLEFIEDAEARTRELLEQQEAEDVATIVNNDNLQKIILSLAYLRDELGDDELTMPETASVLDFTMLTSSVKTLRMQIDACREREATLLQNIDEADTAQLTQQIIDLVNKQIALDASLNGRTEALREAEERISVLHDDSGESARLVESLQEQVNQLRSTLSVCQQGNVTLQADLDAACVSISEMKASRSVLEEDQLDLQKKVSDVLTLETIADEKIEVHRANNARARDSLEDKSQQRHNELTELMHSITQELERSPDTEELKNIFGPLQEKLSEAEQQNQDLLLQLLEMTDERIEAETMVQEREEVNQLAQATAEDLSKTQYNQVQSMQTKLHEIQEQNMRLSSQLVAITNIQERTTKLEQSVLQKNKTISELNDKLVGEQARNENLHAQLLRITDNQLEAEDSNAEYSQQAKQALAVLKEKYTNDLEVLKQQMHDKNEGQKAAVEELGAALREEQNTVTKLEKRTQALEARKNELTRENDDLTRQLLELADGQLQAETSPVAEMRRLREEMSALKTEENRKEEAFTSQIAALTAERDALQGAADKNRNKLGAADSQNKELMAQLLDLADDQLRAEEGMAVGESGPEAAAQAKVHELEEKLAKLATEKYEAVHGLEVRLASCVQARNTLLAEIQQLNTKLSAEESGNKDLLKQLIEIADSQLEAEMQAVEEAEATIPVEEIDESIFDSYKNKISMLTEEKNRLDKKILDQQRIAQEDRSALTETIKNLKNKLGEIESEQGSPLSQEQMFSEPGISADQLEALKEELERESRENVSNRLTIKNLEVALGESDSQQELLQFKLDGLVASEQELKVRSQELQEQVVKLAQAAIGSPTSSQASEPESRKVEFRLSELKASLMETQDDLADSKRREIQLEESLEATRRTLDQQEQDAEEAEEALRAQLKELQKRVLRLSKPNERPDLGSTGRSLSEPDVKSDLSTTQPGDHQNKVKVLMLEGELEALRASSKAADKRWAEDLNTALKEAQEITEANQQLKEEDARLKEHVAELKKRVVALGTGILEEPDQLVQSLEKELVSKSKAMQAHGEKSAAEVAGVAKKLADAEAKNQELGSELARSEKHLGELQERVVMLTKKSTVDEKDKKIQSLMKENFTLMDTLKTAEGVEDELREQVKDVQRRLLRIGARTKNPEENSPMRTPCTPGTPPTPPIEGRRRPDELEEYQNMLNESEEMRLQQAEDIKALHEKITELEREARKRTLSVQPLKYPSVEYEVSETSEDDDKAEMQKEIIRKNEMLNQLKEELQKIQQQAPITGDLELVKKIEELENANRELVADVKCGEEIESKLRTQLRDMQKRILRLSKEKSIPETPSSDLESQIADGDAKLEKVTRQLAVSEKKIENLQDKLRKVEQQLDEANAGRQEAERAARQEPGRSKQAAHVEGSQRIAELERENKELANDLKTSSEIEEKLQAQLRDMQKRMQRLTKKRPEDVDIPSINAKIAKLEAQLREAHLREAMREGELDTLREALDLKHRQLEEEQNGSREARLGDANLLAKVAELESEKHESAQIEEKLRSQLRDMQRRIMRVEKRRPDEAAQLAEVESLKAQLASRADRPEVEMTIRTLADSLEAKDAALNAALEELKAHKKGDIGRSRQATDLEIRIKELEQDKKYADEIEKKLRSQLREMQKRLTRMSKESPSSPSAASTADDSTAPLIALRKEKETAEKAWLEEIKRWQQVAREAEEKTAHAEERLQNAQREQPQDTVLPSHVVKLNQQLSEVRTDYVDAKGKIFELETELELERKNSTAKDLGGTRALEKENKYLQYKASLWSALLDGIKEDGGSEKRNEWRKINAEAEQAYLWGVQIGRGQSEDDTELLSRAARALSTAQVEKSEVGYRWAIQTAWWQGMLSMATRLARHAYNGVSPRTSPYRSSRVNSPSMGTLLSGRSSPLPMPPIPWVPTHVAPGIPEAARASPLRISPRGRTMPHDLLHEPSRRTPIKTAATRQRRGRPVSSPVGDRAYERSMSSHSRTPRRSFTPTNYFSRVQDVQRKLNMLRSELQENSSKVAEEPYYEKLADFYPSDPPSPWVPPPGRTSPTNRLGL
eukprot:TRINITY_DN13873_c0_g1_i3.p1 TRINITY_DN13873_c0_g1~~TRINITY_DN13873_c0_g1_i3.p1  ORF type:complete len:2548 (+),score=763.50 TRINITY_DN13873_c0_g1_i3:1175-8818(+)